MAAAVQTQLVEALKPRMLDCFFTGKEAVEGHSIRGNTSLQLKYFYLVIHKQRKLFTVHTGGSSRGKTSYKSL